MQHGHFVQQHPNFGLQLSNNYYKCLCENENWLSWILAYKKYVNSQIRKIVTNLKANLSACWCANLNTVNEKLYELKYPV